MSRLKDIEDMVILHEAMENLSDMERAVLQMRADGYRMKEIAEILLLRDVEVTEILKSAREKIKREVE